MPSTATTTVILVLTNCVFKQAWNHIAYIHTHQHTASPSQWFSQACARNQVVYWCRVNICLIWHYRTPYPFHSYPTLPSNVCWSLLGLGLSLQNPLKDHWIVYSQVLKIYRSHWTIWNSWIKSTVLHWVSVKVLACFHGASGFASFFGMCNCM